MTCLRCPEFLLYVLLLHQAYSEGPEPEPTFSAQGATIEMGFCFGVDYIVVYRSAPEGDQLLGNSSANDVDVTPPADLHNRTHLSRHQYLLGLKITNLTHKDSGLYRRECWQNRTLISHLTQRLHVCNEEVESQEIVVKEKTARTELLCNSTYIGMGGTSVRWYYEKYPTYKLTLFIDSHVSLEPLVEELRGGVQVGDGGASLVLNNTVLKNIPNFYCLVTDGKNCLSFQNMYLQDPTESTDVFVSQGDRVVLKCPSEGKDQQWDTPLGRINGSSLRNSRMYISAGVDADDFSLMIPFVTDEHKGDYACVSSSLERQYILVLCPKQEPQEKIGHVGGNVSLVCKVGHDDAQTVQWYRADASGECILIFDPNSKMNTTPEDLKGRVSVSDDGSVLTISSARMEDAAVYCCVVLRVPKFLGYDDEYKFDYDGEESDDDYDHYWLNADRCIFKQESHLTIRPVTFEPVNRSPDANPSADPPSDSNSTTYAAAGGVAGLLALVAIAAVIVIKKRRATSSSGLNTSKDIRMNEDPGCTKSLTSDDCGT